MMQQQLNQQEREMSSRREQERIFNIRLFKRLQLLFHHQSARELRLEVPPFPCYYVVRVIVYI